MCGHAVGRACRNPPFGGPAQWTNHTSRLFRPTRWRSNLDKHECTCKIRFRGTPRVKPLNARNVKRYLSCQRVFVERSSLRNLKHSTRIRNRIPTLFHLNQRGQPLPNAIAACNLVPQAPTTLEQRHRKPAGVRFVRRWHHGVVLSRLQALPSRHRQTAN